MYSLSYSKIKKELNWKPKISIDEGLDKTISWFKENIKSLEKESILYKHKK